MNALDDSANTDLCTLYEDSANFLKNERLTKTEYQTSGPVQTSCFCRAELNSGIKFDKSTAEARRLNQIFELSSTTAAVLNGSGTVASINRRPRLTGPCTCNKSVGR